jgi:protein O-mannosyl-transferase
MTASSDRASKVWRSPWLPAAALALLVVIVYAPALKAGFIWDDDAHLTENPCITGLLGLKEVWTSSHAVYYPLVLTNFWVLHKFVGLNPLPYHLLNILLHSGSAVLLWRVLRQLGVRGAWLGAALWALHPVMVQSVAWITELKNTQSCFFYLLSILFFLKADDAATQPRRRRWLFIAALLFFAMAITSKPATVMLPVVLALCLWWKRRLRWRHLAVLAPFLLLSAAASGWTIWEQKFHAGATGLEWSESWAQRLAIAGRDIWFYLGKLLWPHPLIFIYPRWKIDIHQVTAFLPSLGAAIALLFLWWKRNGPLRPVFFGAAYFVVSLFPVLGFFNVFFFRYSFVSDHFQYLASMGPLALAASGGVTACRSFPKARPWLEPAVGGALLLILGILSWRQTATYRDLETLWRTTAARNPDCWLAHTNLGVVLKDQGKGPEAEQHYRGALRLKPDFAEALTSLGAYQAEKGEFEEAIKNFRAALESSPNFVPALYNLGKSLAAKGKIDEAIASYEAAVRADATHFDARNDLAIQLSRAGRLDEAVGYYEEGLRIRPESAKAHNNLGVVLGQLERLNEAEQHLKEALRLEPESAQTYVNLAGVLVRLGRREEAVENLEKALRISPNHAEAKYRLRELGVQPPE